MADATSFESYLMARQRDLLRSAYLLTGDVHAAEDLVQAAALKVWSRWSRVAATERPDAYVQKVLVNTFLSWRRRRWKDEVPSDRVEDAGHDPLDGVPGSLEVWQRLQTLTAQQRAVVVLRYYEDLTQEEVARVLGCGVGTVKTQCSRALSKLRATSTVEGIR